MSVPEIIYANSRAALTYKGVGIVSKVEVNTVAGLLDAHRSDGTGGVTIFDAWVA